MTVPALDTNIGMFAYWKATGVTEVLKADILPLLHSYTEYPEYVDGTIKIFDTGASGSHPNNHSLVWVRIRTDGWILAWLPQTEQVAGKAFRQGSGSAGTLIDISAVGKNIGTVATITDTSLTLTGISGWYPNQLCGQVCVITVSAEGDAKLYLTIKDNTSDTISFGEGGKYGENGVTVADVIIGDDVEIVPSRGNLVWWNHHSDTSGSPPSYATRLGRAIYELWEELKVHQTGISTTAQDLDGTVYEGTFDSGDVNGNAVDTGMIWTPSQWIGYVLHIKDGTCAGYYRVDTNTADTLRCIDEDFTLISSGDKYEILMLDADHTLDYSSVSNPVDYYDFEFGVGATKLYILGYSKFYSSNGARTDDHYFYYNIPSGQTVYSVVASFGGMTGRFSSVFYANASMDYNYSRYIGIGGSTAVYTTDGYMHFDFTGDNQLSVGTRRTLRNYAYTRGGAKNPVTASTSVVIVTSG